MTLSLCGPKTNLENKYLQFHKAQGHQTYHKYNLGLVNHKIQDPLITWSNEITRQIKSAASIPKIIVCSCDHVTNKIIFYFHFHNKHWINNLSRCFYGNLLLRNPVDISRITVLEEELKERMTPSFFHKNQLLINHPSEK